MLNSKIARRSVAVLLFALPLLYLTTLRAANAPASPLDDQARMLLLSADRIKVIAITAYDNGNTIGLGIDSYEETVGDFPPARLSSWIEGLELFPQPETRGWGSDTIPSLFLVFFKGKKEIASIGLDYGASPNTYFADLQAKDRYFLRPESAFALREIAARQPQFIKAMVKLGAKPQDMAPQRAYEIKN